MRALIDTNALIYLLNPKIPRNLADRMKGLLEEIERTRGKLVIPAQVLGEYLSGTGPAGDQIIASLSKNRNIEIANFDYLAATECALMDRRAITAGHKRAPLARDAIWQKVKVDRQIVAIAKVRNVDIIVSADSDISTLAKALGMRCVTVEDIDLPDWAVQMSFDEVIDASIVKIPSHPEPVRTEQSAGI